MVCKEQCHVRGVLTFASGDQYLGEFKDNAFEGNGVYVWKSGTIYRGQWRHGLMNGCGVKLSKQPNGRFISEEGEFVEDEWKGQTKACKIEDARKAAANADAAAEMAKAFESSSGESARMRTKYVKHSTSEDKNSLHKNLEATAAKFVEGATKFQEETKKIIQKIVKVA